MTVQKHKAGAYNLYSDPISTQQSEPVYFNKYSLPFSLPQFYGSTRSKLVLIGLITEIYSNNSIIGLDLYGFEKCLHTREIISFSLENLCAVVDQLVNQGILRKEMYISESGEVAVYFPGASLLTR